MSTLEELLNEGARKIRLGANRPLDLSAEDLVWLVVEGMVEIFAVDSRPRSLGSRTHLATVFEGEILLGMGRAPSGRSSREVEPRAQATLLGVAHPGSAVLETRATALTRLAHQTDHVAVLEDAVEGWVSALFRRIPRSQAPTRFEELAPGSEVRLQEEGASGRTANGVVWVRHLEGESLFLGRPELAVTPRHFLLPVTEDTWISSTAGSVLSCVATRHLLQSGMLWDGLRQFHELFLRYVVLQFEAAEREERARIVRRADLDSRTLHSAFDSLASVLSPGSREPALLRGPAMAAGSADELFEAARAAAGHAGIELTAPPASQASRPGREVSQICDASRVQARMVLLRDDWWHRDGGPLLAFLSEPSEERGRRRRGRPVALLPSSPTSYELLDPRDATRVRVDAAVAEGLDGEAYMFYPSLPEDGIGPKDLLRLVFRGSRFDVLTILLMGLGGGLLSLLVPIVTGELFGQVIPSADRSQLLQMTLGLFVAALAAAAFQATRSIAVLRLTGKIDGKLQAAVWQRLVSLPSTFFRRYTVGDLTNRAMGIDAIRNLLLGNVTTSLLALVFSVFSFGLLFYYSVSLALAAVGLIALMAGVTTLLTYLQLRHQRVLLEIQGKISSLLFGLMSGISKLHTSGAEKRAFAVWSESFAEQRRREFKVRRLANLQTAFNSAYPVITLLALFALMGKALDSGLSVSQFLAFNAAFGQVQAAALTFIALISGLLSIVPIYERLRVILDEPPEVSDAMIDPGELSGEIEMAHVNFKYQEDGPLILHDVSMRVEPGEFVAIVGPSGSGKSTALRLLLGFERAGSGAIYYDRQDLKSLNLQAVRRQIGVVLQNSKPMAGSIFSNIIGSSNLGVDDAWEAARLAGLKEDIEAMPMGIHTIVSEGAGTFSGGQIQRLMIARAIVHRPRILFFDEATSALDNRTQDIVSRSLERLKATRIVVAHRLSTIRQADRIYVMEAGRVVESGSFEELVERRGLFARLAERQTV